MDTKNNGNIRHVTGIAAYGAQLAGLVGLWWLCQLCVRALDLPVPAGVIGMLALVVLLASGALPSRFVRRGAGSLLDHLLLFFVPACMTLLDHKELLSVTGLKLLAVIVVGILTVMAGTALIVELHFRGRTRHVR
ncbi:CidA/LrgA family protein [Solidesulfovibrio sp.]|uniref:CidA/LrgA family protein n=1 Tax=Solidesulfovibrio sp. TaxID=2910990 RepID=UPI00260A3A83|nr:CidA/LrgA family protein [Solidesulfovibrio sp.]